MSKAADLILRAGDDPPVLCLLCAVLATGGEMPVIVKLTGKKAGE